ncbi:MAG: patatin-like phospholipase family protein [Endozoicomonas sp.]|uniref:patatin-like phospholipase family protein n=1 Tax=Endozoicomonas sp. TaxID=1892382 RepID=UPI003D9B46E6
MSDVLEIRAGSRALTKIRDEGLPQSSIDVMLGASGGPKWFVLSGLDKALIGEYFKDRKQPLNLLGTSAGAWRFSCYAQKNALEAHHRFEQGYLLTEYSAEPDAEEVSRKCRVLIRDMLGNSGAGEVVSNAIMRFNLIAVKSRGLTKSEANWKQMAGLGLAATGNLISRKTLGAFFTRVLFHHPDADAPFYGMDNLPTQRVSLSEDNILDAIMASGSIPLVMEGVRDIAGSPKGVYRDGGVIDYHFDMAFPQGDGLTLYPHFYSRMVPGWFDKSLKWRKPAIEHCDQLVMVSPSESFVSKLPYGKIPDRTDFKHFSFDDRVKYWKQVIEESDRLGEAFLEAVATDKIRQKIKPFSSSD